MRQKEITYTEIIEGIECGQWEEIESIHVTPESGSFFGFHIWEICALHQIQSPYPSNTPGPITFPTPSTSSMPGTVINVPLGTLIGPFTFWGNPLWTYLNPNGTNPPINPNYPYMNYFYDWVVTQVGPIGIGDKIEFDTSAQQSAWPQPSGSGITHPYSAMCTSSLTSGRYTGATNKVCLKYIGVCQQPNTYCWPTSGGFGSNVMNATVTLHGCDCKYFGLGGESQIAGWDCYKDISVYEANLMGTPDKCVPRYYPITGVSPQFATKQDCINSGCGQITTGPTPVITTP
jgi:hypothetical protein